MIFWAGYLSNVSSYYSCWIIPLSPASKAFLPQDPLYFQLLHLLFPYHSCISFRDLFKCHFTFLHYSYFHPLFLFLFDFLTLITIIFPLSLTRMKVLQKQGVLLSSFPLEFLRNMPGTQQILSKHLLSTLMTPRVLLFQLLNLTHVLED